MRQEIGSGLTAGMFWGTFCGMMAVLHEDSLLVFILIVMMGAMVGTGTALYINTHPNARKRVETILLLSAFISMAVLAGLIPDLPWYTGVVLSGMVMVPVTGIWVLGEVTKEGLS